jgi:AbrB family looped-hinge helix DNA binding protein
MKTYNRKITDGFRMTIPKDVRKVLHCKKGDIIIFLEGPNNQIVMKKQKT